jgi:hypothetical protein
VENLTAHAKSALEALHQYQGGDHDAYAFLIGALDDAILEAATALTYVRRL